MKSLIILFMIAFLSNGFCQNRIKSIPMEFDDFSREVGLQGSKFEIAVSDVKFLKLKILSKSSGKDNEKIIPIDLSRNDSVINIVTLVKTMPSSKESSEREEIIVKVGQSKYASISELQKYNKQCLSGCPNTPVVQKVNTEKNEIILYFKFIDPQNTDETLDKVNIIDWMKTSKEYVIVSLLADK